MAKTPKSGSRMAQTRYDAANKRTTGLINKGWPASGGSSNTAYQEYLKAERNRAKLGSTLKSKPAGSGKKK